MLAQLVADHTTGRPIVWGAGAATAGYRAGDPVTVAAARGIVPRAEKHRRLKTGRTKQSAEVFTPRWVVNRQLDLVDKQWAQTAAAHHGRDRAESYLHAHWVEITCGEGPYLVGRSDAVTGDAVPVEQRAGILDRKLRLVASVPHTPAEFFRLVCTAVSTCHGFDINGDSLLLARVNMLAGAAEWIDHVLGTAPTEDQLVTLAGMISRNLVQTNVLDNPGWRPTDRRGKPVAVAAVVGNPPYQKADNDSGKGSAQPLYQRFFSWAQENLRPQIISLITPSVWFAGGKGLDGFRTHMTTTPHLVCLTHVTTSGEVFGEVNLRGGVSWFVCDLTHDNRGRGVDTTIISHGRVVTSGTVANPGLLPGLFIADHLAADLVDRLLRAGAITADGAGSFADLVSVRNPFGLATTFTRGRHFSPTANGLADPVRIIASHGHSGWAERRTVTRHPGWIDRWKVLTPFANNVGTSLADDNINTLLAAPGSAATETYLVIGAGLDADETMCGNIRKYLATRFVRFLVSAAKANHNGTRKTYRLVPLQDFRPDSLIDWRTSVDGIDRQLADVYCLTGKERDHINRMIKPCQYERATAGGSGTAVSTPPTMPPRRRR
ncbi:Eco57I restriction-modification methylase domain-containing protein [Corynebacterium mendelii]|uniref:Eco57I restriction-modification methylase domain-containing protein n=1 Tax=Corynebacterium mendelii TaxID=2765362 RepID=UPI001A92AC68